MALYGSLYFTIRHAFTHNVLISIPFLQGAMVGEFKKRFLQHYIEILPKETLFPPDVRVTIKWTETLYRDYVPHVANFCATVFKYLLTRNHF